MGHPTPIRYVYMYSATHGDFELLTQRPICTPPHTTPVVYLSKEGRYNVTLVQYGKSVTTMCQQ